MEASAQPSAAEAARLDERHRSLANEVHLLREEVKRIEGRLWALAAGSGVVAGGVAGGVASLVQYFGG